MSISIRFEILQRTGIVSATTLKSGVIYQIVHEYKGENPGRVTSYLEQSRGSINDYLIDVIVDGRRIQSFSGLEWLNCEWANEWNKIRSGKIQLEHRRYQ